MINKFLGRVFDKLLLKQSVKFYINIFSRIFKNIKKSYKRTCEFSFRKILEKNYLILLQILFISMSELEYIQSCNKYSSRNLQ